MDASLMKEFFRWAGSSTQMELGIPDTRKDATNDGKRVYWCKLTVREMESVDAALRQKVIGETLMHWREAAECFYRGERVVTNDYYAKRSATLDTPINAPLIMVDGSVQVATGEILTLVVTERGTAHSALADLWSALDAKIAIHNLLAGKLGADAIKAIPTIAPRPWQRFEQQGQQQATPAPANNVTPMPPTGTASPTPIYVGQKKSPKNFAYVDGQEYIFDTVAVTCAGELSESGVPMYKWSLWGSYPNKGGGYGQYADFTIDGSREMDYAAVGATMKALGLERVIKTHMPLKLRLTARVRIAQGKKSPGNDAQGNPLPAENVYYFNPVKLEAIAVETVQEPQSAVSY